MSNSKLATVIMLSPNHSGKRTHVIDTITIHCVVGQLSAKQIGNVFLPAARQASSNYGVGCDGSIGLYVDECNRSWCSSSSVNDQRAVTIEVASDKVEPYAVTDKAYNALIDLVTDICRRNGIKKLIWSTDKNKRINHIDGCNMTVHRDYNAQKSCPGTYLYDRHGDIAAKVNARLGGAKSIDTSRAIIREIIDRYGIEITDVERAIAALDKAKNDTSMLSLYWILHKLVNNA